MRQAVDRTGVFELTLDFFALALLFHLLISRFLAFGRR
jgi:hypothetical protein